MKILVADDDPIYREVIGNLLIRWDFDIVLAENGHEALAIMEDNDPPNLILLDWEMPEMDGDQVARAIQNNNMQDDVYILMITGNKRKPDLMQVLLYADDYLIKPFDSLDLKIRLRNAVQILSLKQEVKDLEKRVMHAA